MQNLRSSMRNARASSLFSTAARPHALGLLFALPDLMLPESLTDGVG